MKAKSISKYIRQSPKKIRIVLDEIRGKRVGNALDYLHFSPLKASYVIEKTVRSAVANLMQSIEDSKMDPDSLIIEEAFADLREECKIASRIKTALDKEIGKLSLTIYSYSRDLLLELNPNDFV